GRKFINEMKYIAVIGTSISITVAIVLEPAITNFSAVYYILVITLIYMHVGLTIYSVLYSLSIMVYMGIFQEGIGVTTEMLAPYFLYFIMIAILSFALLRVSYFMVRNIEDANAQTEK